MIGLQVVAICVLLLLSAFAGAWAQKLLPAHHRSRDTIDSIRLVITMLVTLSAVVLGLLISSAKQRHDDEVANLERYSVDLIELDQRLRQYGPEAADIRAELRAYTAAAIADTWRQEPPPTGQYPRLPASTDADPVEAAALGDMLASIDHAIQALAPADPFHLHAAERLRARAADVLQQRWNLIASTHGTISWPFLTVMLCWLVIMFAIFGISSPPNALVYVVVVLSALSISSSVYLILDFDSPQTGLIRVPSLPMRDALAHMDRPAT